MNEIETAWVAGLLEGEGSFILTVSRPPRKDGQPSRRVINVVCGSTDKDIIEKLYRLTGVGRIYEDKVRTDGVVQGRKRMYRWQVSRREDLLLLLKAIRPHMGERRGAKIDELIEHAQMPPLGRMGCEIGCKCKRHKGCGPDCTCGRHSWSKRTA